jgi:ribonuclease Z
LVLDVTEVSDSFDARKARFRLKRAFALEELGSAQLVNGVLCDNPTFRVVIAVLEHRTPCLAFAIEEPAHINVWKNRLQELGLPVGPWLRKLKRAVLENRPDHELIEAGMPPSPREMPLGVLRKAVTVIPGQKVAYVTDAADTPANRDVIVALAHNADILFIEAAFAKADAQLAAERAHLTTDAAGSLARAAEVRRVEPFHFSPRYSGQDERMVEEVMAAFTSG